VCVCARVCVRATHGPPHCSDNSSWDETPMDVQHTVSSLAAVQISSPAQAGNTWVHSKISPKTKNGQHEWCNNERDVGVKSAHAWKASQCSHLGLVSRDQLFQDRLFV
jgi:hypothetical protein